MTWELAFFISLPWALWGVICTVRLLLAIQRALKEINK